MGADEGRRLPGGILVDTAQHPWPHHASGAYLRIQEATKLHSKHVQITVEWGITSQ